MNASVVEEATAAATSMANQATAFAHSVAQFQLSDDLEARPAMSAHATQPLSVARPGGVLARKAKATASREKALAHGGDED